MKTGFRTGTVVGGGSSGGGGGITTIRGEFGANSSNLPELIITVISEGTYTVITDDGSSGDITFSVNGGAFAAFSSPFVLQVGDELNVNRTINTGAGWYEITGTY